MFPLDEASLLKKGVMGLWFVICEEQCCVRAQARVPLMCEERHFCVSILLHGEVLCLFIPLSAFQAQCCVCVRVVLCFYVFL